MKTKAAVFILLMGFSALGLYANNNDQALDHVRVDTSKYEDIPHVR